MPKCPACNYKDDDDTMFSEAWNGFCLECASLEAIHEDPNAYEVRELKKELET
jgi:hypothetical protein